MNRHLQGWMVVLSLLPALFLAGAGSGVAQPLEKVHVVVLEGTQLFPMVIMHEQGFDRAQGIEVRMTKTPGPQGVYTIMESGNFDVAFGGWPTVALMRAHGYDVTNVYPVSGYTNEVLVRNGSPLKTFGDLRGSRIGLFGGPNAATTWLFRLECVKFFGFDPAKAAEIIYGAPPLLAGQLDKGGLDAILILDPLIAQLLPTGKYRSVGNIGQIWKEKTGQVPLLVAVTFNGAWARAHTQTAKDFVAAFKQSVGYLRAHPGAWPALARGVNIHTPAGIELLRQRVVPSFINRWEPQFFEEQNAFLTELGRVFGEVEGMPKTIPPETFTTRYLP